MEESENKAKIRKALQKLETYNNLILEGNIQEKDKSLILQDLLEMLQILYDYAPIPCLETIKVNETLTKMYHTKLKTFNTPQIWKDGK